MNELRFAARRLRQSPGFATTALLVLAIGIGLNTAIFSVVDGLVLRPPPFPQPDRIVAVGEEMKGFGHVSTAYANFLDWQHDAKSFEGAAALNTGDATLSDRNSAERLPVLRVTWGFFDVIRTYPEIGRGFRPDEDKNGAGGRVVLTNALWMRRFAGDPQIVGKSLNLEGQAFTVIGVLPASFNFPLFKCDALIPFGPTADMNRGNHTGEAIARLRPGVTIAQADTELRAIARGLAERHPESNVGWGLSATSLQNFLTKDFRAVMLTLLAAVALVLLIACVNLAGLMLVRAAGRRRELALRTALGARPWAILRETLTESLLLAVGGGVLGVLLGTWGVTALLSFLPENTPVPHISLDARVLAFSIGVTALASLLFGLAPALRTLGSDPNEALKESGRANTGGVQGNRLRGALVVAEIGLALVLALGAGLVMKSFDRLMHVDPGFDANRALTMRIALTGPRYEKATTAFWDRFLESASHQPAIAAIGLDSFLPLSDNDTQSSYFVEGLPKPKNFSDYPFADRFVIGGDYLNAMGIPLLRGRAFRNTDDEKAPGVLLVDEEFAKRNFPGDDPLRHRVIFNKKPWQIVGIVRHVKAYGLNGDQTREQFYFPYRQSPSEYMTVAVHPAADSASAVGTVRNIVHAIDPGVPVFSIRSMSGWLTDSTWRDRLSTLLLSLFAGVALILAAIGIYGVMAYSVAQRTQEIGIRLALGATPNRVLRLVLKQACILSAIGIGLGALIAVPVVSLMKAILYRVSPSDAGVFTLAAVLLAIVALAAGAIPAWRAARADPMSAMRYE